MGERSGSTYPQEAGNGALSLTIKLLACSGSLDGGGSERQLWQLVTNLPESDFSSELFLVYRRGPFLDRVPSVVPIHAFSDVKSNQPTLRLPGAIHRSQVAFVRRLIEQRSIQLVYDRTFHMTLITSKACKLAGCPRVSVIVSPPSFDFVRSNERFKWLKYRILRRAYSDPSAVTVCVSQAVADDASAYYQLPKNNFHVIPNPVDIHGIQKLIQNPIQAESTDSLAMPIKEQKTDSTRSEPVNRQTLRAVVVGRMTAEKGHATMLEAVRAWNQLHQQPGWIPLEVDFIGDGPLRDSLLKQAVDIGVSNQIHFRDFQTNPYPWISRADVVCIPSTYEGLPNVALEAMVLRRPVVATNSSSSLLTLIGQENERGQLVKVGDAGAIAQALMNLVDNRNQWTERCESAYAWVEREHSLESWIKRMSQLFCELTSSKRLPKIGPSN